MAGGVQNKINCDDTINPFTTQARIRKGETLGLLINFIAAKLVPVKKRLFPLKTLLLLSISIVRCFVCHLWERKLENFSRPRSTLKFQINIMKILNSFSGYFVYLIQPITSLRRRHREGNKHQLMRRRLKRNTLVEKQSSKSRTDKRFTSE